MLKIKNVFVTVHIITYGTQIHVVVPTEIKEKYKQVLTENMNFIVQNFDVEKNNLALKHTNHPFKLIFNRATFIEDVNKHTIVSLLRILRIFHKLKEGNCRPGLFNRFDTKF
jgi:hypothetical protein